MNLKNFYQECKKRSVISNLSVYAVSSWVLIQVAATTFPYLGIPKSAVTLVIILVLIGLPLTIILSWYYNIIPDPEDVVSDTVPKSKSLKSRNRSFIVFISIVSIAILAVIYQLIQKNLSGDENSISDRIESLAVANFKNNTQDTTLNSIGSMVSNYISFGLSQYDIASIIDYNTVEEYKKISRASLGVQGSEIGLDHIFGSIQIIEGSYYRDGDTLIFQSYITENGEDKFLHTFNEIECHLDNPLEGIKILKQHILGYLGTKEDPELAQNPPLYDAYQYYLLARDNWYRNPVLVEKYLLKSLEIDPTFADAQLTLAGHYFNVRSFNSAKELLENLQSRVETIDPELKLSEGQKLDLDYHFALLEKDHRKVFDLLRLLYKRRPNDIFSNISLMVAANEFVNQPELVLDIYNEFNDENVNYEDCFFCAARVRNAAVALNSLGEPQKAIALLEPVLEFSDQRILRTILIKSYMMAGQRVKLREFVDEQQSIKLNKDPKYLYLIAAQESHLFGYEGERDYYVKKGLEVYANVDKRIKVRSRLHLLGQGWNEALNLLENQGDSDKKRIETLRYLAVIYFAKGENEKAQAIVEEMEEIAETYLPGKVSYYIAEAYSSAKNRDKMYEYLKKSLKEGRKYNSTSFKNDYLLRDYFDDEQFTEIMSYWK